MIGMRARPVFNLSSMCINFKVTINILIILKFPNIRFFGF